MNLRNFASVIGTGRITPAAKGTEYWKRAEKLLPEIIDKYKHTMESPPVGPGRLMSLNVQVVTGLYYYLTISIEHEDGVIATYEAKFWLQVGSLGTKILSFDKVPGSETTSKSSETDKEVSPKKKGLDVFKGLTLPPPMTNSGIVSGNLQTRAFCILVEQIRSQRNWNYSRAKKCASNIWKKLSESEKRIFLGEAARRSEKN
ncbi:uncharacterized protein LOC141606603 [Silene latifolia]|uniref:uncharacterized protein LOC141606603 n=1 Tax=Silene latifolia TaxID=37657 RepID=UPI003D76C6AA